MNEEKRAEIIHRAARQAVEVARAHGLRIGQTVAHPHDPITYELIRIDGQTATVEWDGTVKKFPLDELFDPNEALRIAVNIKNQLQRECLEAAGLN